MLNTARRPGEILSLQWRDVSLDRGERIIPISTRLVAILEMRQSDPAGQDLPPEAYVFGDALGRRVKSVQAAWATARRVANLGDFQFRDLRHEAASWFDKAGVPIVYVSSLLGHSNLSTTSRYLNIHRRGLHLAMQKLEESRALAPTLHKPGERPLAVVQEVPAANASKATVQ